MDCTFTDELSPEDVNREDFLYRATLQRWPGLEREVFKECIDLGENYAMKMLCKKEKQPPWLSRSWLRFEGSRQWFIRYFDDTNYEWPMAKEEPETHAPPYSLAYLKYWYDYTHKGKSTEQDGHGGSITDLGERVILAPPGAKPTHPELLMPLWKTLVKTQEAQEGGMPFEVVVPPCRRTEKVFGDPDKTITTLSELSDLLGPEIAVFIETGEPKFRSTVFLGVRPGADISNVGLQCRFAWAWRILLCFGRLVVNKDVNILDTAKGVCEKDLDHNLATGPAYAELKDAWAKVEAEDKERCKTESPDRATAHRDMARLYAAQQCEFDRLADQVTTKVLAGGLSFDEKAQNLAYFVERGHDQIRLTLPSARARVAERLATTLAADLVREIVLPESGHTAEKQATLVQGFVTHGHSRIPSLDDALARFAVVEDVWPPIAQATSSRALRICRGFLMQARAQLDVDHNAERNISESGSELVSDIPMSFKT